MTTFLPPRSRKVRVLATLGPASSSPEMIEKLFLAGADAFRINMSHGDQESKIPLFEAIRSLEMKLGRPTTILADLQGPKLRVGKFADGKIVLKKGQTFTLDRDSAPGDENRVQLPHPEIFAAIETGARLLLDDGKLVLRVTDHGEDTITTRVEVGGPLSNSKGLNVPDVVLPMAALTEKDRSDLAFALEQGADWIALSFVQRPEDIAEARKLIEGRAALLAKIEKPSAISRLVEIVEQCDGVMVARGDLGVECPVEDVPIMQRRIIRACRRAGKPVIVATHMLESMVQSSAPTRAEASDISTAVNQGADAVMLSAETAVGRHPQTAVAIMDRIIRATEDDPETNCYAIFHDEGQHNTTADAVSLSARNITEVLDCRFAIAYTNTGSTARRLSRDRPHAPILAATPNRNVAQSLSLCWGVSAIVTEDITDFRNMIERADQIASQSGGKDGERIVILSGFPFGRSGKTNTLKIGRIGGPDQDRD